MSKSILLKTIILVCLIISIGFLAVGIINYYSESKMYRRNVEEISLLTSEGIYHRLDSIFAKPINISLTMANDNFLIDFLEHEDAHAEDNEYIRTIQEYLDAYRQKYDYDSVFLASAKSGRYYNFNGLDRILEKDDPENVWFYSFLEAPPNYSLNVDNDLARQNEITVFVNCSLTDDSGAVIGVVGVGLRIGYMQSLLREYAHEFDVDTFLINDSGDIEISTDITGYQTVNHFEVCGYPELKDEILSQKETNLSYWRSVGDRNIYIVTQYIPGLDWHLIIEKDMGHFSKEMRRQFFNTMLVVFISVIAVLLVITQVIRSFNKQITELTASLVDERQKAFRWATESHFDDIYEVNVTTNRIAGKTPPRYFKRLGLPDNMPFDKAMKILAEKQIKEAYRVDYLNTFSIENVLREYQKGNTSLQYEFQISVDGEKYCWLRTSAHIYHVVEDDSIHMLCYRQNIDEEKRKEKQAQTDGLTKLYNKTSTEWLIRHALAESKEEHFGFFILDIDDFKQINDRHGHAFGDRVIQEFAATLKSSSRKEDVIGRIGGDEFVIFLPVSDYQLASKKAETLVSALSIDFSDGEASCSISASIGVSISPGDGEDFETLYKNADAALYKTKKRGKGGYTLFYDMH